MIKQRERLQQEKDANIRESSEIIGGGGPGLKLKNFQKKFTGPP